MLGKLFESLSMHRFLHLGSPVAISRLENRDGLEVRSYWYRLSSVFS